MSAEGFELGLNTFGEVATAPRVRELLTTEPINV